MKKSTLTLVLAAAALAVCFGPAWAQTCVPAICQAANNTADVHIAFLGATAPAPSIMQAATELYGAAIKDCTNNVRVFKGCRDLDGNAGNGAETCVEALFAQRNGSCEGVQALDRKETSFLVCDPAGGGGSGGTRSIVGLLDENGKQIYANFTSSDVRYQLCEPVVTASTITRPTVFDSTEDPVFVEPFSLIVNRGIETYLPAASKPSPADCPYGAGDCVKLDLSISKDQGKDIWGNNNLCDWRWVSPNVTGTNPLTIGTVIRNRLSGTRRNFNATFLETVSPGQGNIFEAGSGGLVGAVNTNQWCGNTPSLCGENQSTGALGGGAVSPACNASATVISAGQLGGDRLAISDNNTPADPFDDYAIRGASGDNYDVLQYDGKYYSKVNIRCGRYDYWSQERMYYDNDSTPDGSGNPGYYFPPGSIREAAVLELMARAAADAVSDPTVVANSQMLVSRARDGAPVFPSSPYNATLCAKP